MSSVHDETPSLQDLCGDANVGGFGMPDEPMLDPDGLPDRPLTDEDIDRLWIAEMERREAEMFPFAV